MITEEYLMGDHCTRGCLIREHGAVWEESTLRRAWPIP